MLLTDYNSFSSCCCFKNMCRVSSHLSAVPPLSSSPSLSFILASVSHSHTHTKSKTLCLERNLPLPLSPSESVRPFPTGLVYSGDKIFGLLSCVYALSVNRSVFVVALTIQAKSIVGHACADHQIRNPVRPRRWESSVWSAGSVALLGRPFYKVGRAGGRSQGLFAAWPVQQRSRPILPWAPNTNTFQKAR